MLMKTYGGDEGRDQDGFAALVIAIVLVLVLSLVTVGFATLMRREEKAALDKHLSEQAYYAAEAGINDASKAINLGFNAAKNTCGPLDTVANPALLSQPGIQYLSGVNSGQVGSDPNIKYTCLLIDPYPKSIDIGSVDNVMSKTYKLFSVNKDDPTAPADLQSLNISWEAAGGGSSAFVTNAGMVTNHQFTPAANWTYAPVLRVTLTPLASGGISRTDLSQKTYTAFLYPNSSASATITDQYGNGIGTAQGVIVNGNCHGGQPAYACNVTVDQLTTNYYLITLRSIYGNSQVHITGAGTDGNYVRFKGSQTLVDSTGKAQDVLRRVQVRIPTGNEYPHTDYGIQSTTDICKVLRLTPTDTTSGDSANCPLP
jgi:hypothetical protein